MMINRELPQRVRQTGGATKSVLAVFLNPKEFAIVDLLGQNAVFTALYFVNNVILRWANRHAQQLEDIGHCKLHLHFNNSNGHTGQHVQEQIASDRCVRVPHPGIHPTWPSQTSTFLAGESNNSPGGS
jgi:hypothetical protein